MIDTVAVLLSIGRHPLSGRARLADLDARALEMALNLVDSDRIEAIHVGSSDLETLSDYLGMGLKQITLLRQPPDADIATALVPHLRKTRPSITLAGCVAESTEGSGQLPYVLAHALGLPLLPELAGLTAAGQRATGLQALPRGQRRELEAPLPLLATVARAAPPPRQSAFGKARNGRIAAIDVPGDAQKFEVRKLPARPKPRRIRIATAGSAADRLRALTEMQAGRGELLVNPDPGDAAKAIWDYLVREQIVTAGSKV